MLKSERKQVIMSKIDESQFVTLDSLVTELETSESTVRRDLDELEEEGKLRRVHGGAELTHSLQEELSNQEKAIKNIQEKSAIAQVAADLIGSNEVIFIDAGTTTELLLEHLNQSNLTVVTNSIHHATKLVDRNIKTIVIGGFVKHSTDASIGQIALNQIKQMTVDKAFIGMNGIDEAYLTTPDLEEAAIKKAIIDNSRQTIVLADSFKIGQVAFAKVGPIERVTLVTTRSSASLLQKIKRKTKVIEV